MENSKTVSYLSPNYDGSAVDIVAGVGVNRLAHDIGHDIGDVRRDVCKSESDIRAQVLDAKCDLTRDIQKAEYENRLTTERMAREVENKIVHATERINDRIDDKFDKAMTAIADNSRSLLKLEVGLL